MRGLTDVEADLLESAHPLRSNRGRGRECRPAEYEAGEALVRRGLLEVTPCPSCTNAVVDTTPLGLLALRIHHALRVGAP